jgi:hypothetical protein
METIMLKASATTINFRSAFLILSIAVLTSLSSFAQDSTSTVAAEPAYVNFLRVTNGQLFFTVKFNNPGGRRFDIVVNDSDGENLYRGNFSGKEFGKVFRAPAELGKLYISIRPYGQKTEHKFEISSESRLVQDIYVTAMSIRQ